MWDIIFKGHMGERPLEMQKALTFTKSCIQILGTWPRKEVKSSRKVGERCWKDCL